MEDSKLKILVVEDHDLVQKMAVMTLAGLNYEVDVASTGSEAIRKFQQNQYDFIFMDLGLPDIEGYEVTATIRKLEQKTQSHIPIVALTAHVEGKTKANALAAGMDDFLSKPLTSDKAKEMVEKYAQK